MVCTNFKVKTASFSMTVWICCRHSSVKMEHFAVQLGVRSLAILWENWFLWITQSSSASMNLENITWWSIECLSSEAENSNLGKPPDLWPLSAQQALPQKSSHEEIISSITFFRFMIWCFSYTIKYTVMTMLSHHCVLERDLDLDSDGAPYFGLGPCTCSIFLSLKWEWKIWYTQTGA